MSGGGWSRARRGGVGGVGAAAVVAGVARRRRGLGAAVRSEPAPFVEPDLVNHAQQPVEGPGAGPQQAAAVMGGRAGTRQAGGLEGGGDREGGCQENGREEAGATGHGTAPFTAAAPRQPERPRASRFGNRVR